jgi:hypothetical protein
LERLDGGANEDRQLGITQSADEAAFRRDDGDGTEMPGLGETVPETDRDGGEQSGLYCPLATAASIVS